MTQAAKTIGAGLVATSLVAMSLTAAVDVRAAGLGELQATSGLGQPFEGRIDVSGTMDELESARATIAPESAYDDAGLIRAPVLDSFRIQLVTGQGQPYLRITSRQRIGEPLLQLVLDLRAGNSTVRREYSVLLDPPKPISARTASQQAADEPVSEASAQGPLSLSRAPTTASAAPSATADTARAAQVEVAPTRERHRSTRSRHATSSSATQTGDAGRYGPVQPGETLGSIAEHFRDQLGGSFHSRVNRIQRANPGAFESSRPGWVRLGAVLVIPGIDSAAVVKSSSDSASSGVPVNGTGGFASPSLSTTLGAASGPASIMRFQLASKLADVPVPLAASQAATPAVIGNAQPVAGAAPRDAGSGVAATAATTDRPARNHWLSSFWLWLMLLCIGVLGWLWWTRRRQAAEAERQAMLESEEDFHAPVPVRAMAPMVRAEAASAQTAAAAPPLPSAAGLESLPSRPDAKSENHSASIAELQEGDRGFYGEVAQLLLASLAREPARLDLRMKLLEVYYDSRESELFHKHARHYLHALEGREDEHWLRIQAMGRELLPEAPLFNAQNPNALALAARPLRFYEHDLADTLEPALQALAAEYRALHVDPDFRDELLLNLAVIRPQAAPLTPLGEDGGKDAGRVWCKWERIDPVGDAVHVNAYSQTFMASQLDRRTVISATTSGRHGIAVASAAAELSMGCRIHIQENDRQRQQKAVQEMEGFGATVVVHPNGVAAGDARTAALRDWLQDTQRTFYINSLAAGPNPYPNIVRDFLAVLGAETKAQVIERFRKRPLAVVVGRSDGPSAISILQAFLDDRETALYCIDAEQASVNQSYRREHSWLQHTGRVQYLNGNDVDAALAMRGEEDLGNVSLGSARAAAFALKLAAESDVPGEVVVLMRRDIESMGRLPTNEPAPLILPNDQPEPGLQPVIGLVRSRR